MKNATKMLALATIREASEIAGMCEHEGMVNAAAALRRMAHAWRDLVDRDDRPVGRPHAPPPHHRAKPPG